MIYLKDNAVGVDRVINEFITSLDDTLNSEFNWGIDIYHKIYREPNDNGAYLPYTFKTGKDYKPILLNDRVVGEVGFYLGNSREASGIINVDCDIIFSVNLEKLDNGSLQREDERVIGIAYNAVSKKKKVNQIKTQLPNVLSDFNTDSIKYRDAQPYLNFSMSVTLYYKFECLKN